MNTVGKNQRLRSLAALGVCFALAALLGCGGGGATGDKAALKGKVTYHNAPVTGGTITLIPASGPSFPITINPDGTFAVGDAPTGVLKVAIETDSVSANVGYLPAGAPMPKDSKPVDTANQPKRVPIPAKYNSAETSGLTWDTKKEATKNFELTD